MGNSRCCSHRENNVMCQVAIVVIRYKFSPPVRREPSWPTLARLWTVRKLQFFLFFFILSHFYTSPLLFVSTSHFHRYSPLLSFQRPAEKQRWFRRVSLQDKSLSTFYNNIRVYFIRVQMSLSRRELSKIKT